MQHSFEHTHTLEISGNFNMFNSFIHVNFCITGCLFTIAYVNTFPFIRISENVHLRFDSPAAAWRSCGRVPAENRRRGKGTKAGCCRKTRHLAASFQRCDSDRATERTE